MSKIYAQKMDAVWEYSGSVAANASPNSGNFPCDGYAKLIGLSISSGSGVAGSAIRVRQSTDQGANWDLISACELSACTGTSFSIDIYGETMSIIYHSDPTASTAEFRTRWMLRPI